MLLHPRRYPCLLVCSNIFVGHGQMMKIGDFGMARIVGERLWQRRPPAWLCVCRPEPARRPRAGVSGCSLRTRLQLLARAQA